MAHHSQFTSSSLISLLVYLLVINHGEVAADGVFQLELVRMSNPLSQLANGQCCEETTTNTTTTSDSSSNVCPGGCRTAVHVCLKEFQDTPRPTGRCTFGEYKTDILGPSSFGSLNQGSGTVLIPFNFTWSGLFTLVVKVVHRHQNGTEQLIVQDIKQSALNPDPEWHNISFGGSTTRGMYRIRIRCAPNYYNTTCTKLCKPRNDDFGHHTCDENGDKVCNPGWMGKPNCEKPICKTGCDKVNGYCERPGECRCRFGSGWKGPLCDKCQPAPGCVHGTCKRPYECTCELNWGGVLCNLDLNYCGRHKPCLNGGECRSNQPNHYQCECVPGWTGRHCERRALSCSADPCLHGGTCQAHNNKDYTCLCPPGWTGNNCQQNVNECSSNPCRNGGTCIDGDDGFVCRCTARWQGPFCQLDADECQGRPCVNADACSNLVGDYVCTCQKGWTGKNCDININDCQDQCLHGSTCVDLVDGYHCACPMGYTGTRCEVDTDECASEPCLNGGQCQDLQGTYRCVCPPGYSGGNCQIDTDMCAPNPCENGASCFDMQNGEFYCRCVDGFEGRNCQTRKDEKVKYTATVIDSCTVEDPTGVGRGGGPPRRVSSNVCGAHGECINENNHGAFSCRCHPGYTGKYCHLNINDCASQPCKNQGTCVDGINSLQCICRPGWEGPLCDINVDDCRNAPCRNGGACVDLVNDFRCECEADWKGRMCTLRSSSCEATTCANGGTCHDMGATFSCVCGQGWRGRTCQTRESESCDSSPCQHGATCINSGDSFSCRCPDGYEGATCNININDCNPYPCYNGGKCIDGVNWYECNCTRGFTGPDCRINTNECESNPCTFGSTCIDGIGEYTCICPPGRTGKHCQTVTGDLLPKPQPCVYQNRVFAHQSTWEHDCNSCTCVNGHTSCSKVYCGPQNCLKQPNVTTDPVVTCGRDERCSVQTDVVCLTPPCLPWGRCRKRGRDVTSSTVIPGDAVLKTRCRPGMAQYGYNCVKMTLVFDLEIVPIGVSVEAICRDIRGFQSLRPLASEHTVNVLCKLKEDSQDTIEIAVSLSGFGVDTKGKDPGSVNPTLRRVVDAIALSISRRRVNNTALSAVLEVKEEITIIAETNTLVYVIPLVCSVMGFLGLLLILCLVVWHYRHLSSRHSDYRRPQYSSQEKTNNENEENVRRYRNSIYEKGGGSSHSSRNSSLKSPDTELLEFDLEKYERSETSSKMTMERRNDATLNISPLKTVKLKNINIELEREREGTV